MSNYQIKILDKAGKDSSENQECYQAATLPISSSNPDLISHPPITSEPSISPSVYSVPWTYTPSGPLPLNRWDFYSSSTSVNSNNTVNGKYQQDQNENDALPEIPSHVTVTVESSTTPSAGSRNWSSSLFGSFRDVQKSTEKLSALKLFFKECCCIPCMMCSVAKSLGDKSYLPFIPGTGAAIRFKVRILGGIEGSIADDCLMTSFCCPCAVCQMYREIDDIGLAPT